MVEGVKENKGSVVAYPFKQEHNYKNCYEVLSTNRLSEQINNAM